MGTVFLEDAPQIALAILYMNSQKDASGAGDLNLPNEVWYSMAGSIFNFCFAFYTFFKNRGKRNEAAKLRSSPPVEVETAVVYHMVELVKKSPNGDGVFNEHQSDEYAEYVEYCYRHGYTPEDLEDGSRAATVS